MKIVPYSPKYRKDFVEMNLAWISSMFKVEPEDERELSSIETAIAAGAEIFFAVDDSDNVMACCMIAPRSAGEWEIMKFAAKGMYTGTGAGSACLKACIEYAREKQAKSIVLVSNRRCTHAIHLYEKFGFAEIPVDKEKFPYDRGDISFEMKLFK
ncbi:MAG: GNAT family N-acetyltransferase [Fibrobacter sp.]|nr:GNAT family N-acetyltransferase [Fibrobacter sp.]